MNDSIKEGETISKRFITSAIAAIFFQAVAIVGFGLYRRHYYDSVTAAYFVVDVAFTLITVAPTILLAIILSRLGAQ